MRSVVTGGFQRARLCLPHPPWESALQSRFALVGEYRKSQSSRHTVRYFLLTLMPESKRNGIFPQKAKARSWCVVLSSVRKATIVLLSVTTL